MTFLNRSNFGAAIAPEVASSPEQPVVRNCALYRFEGETLMRLPRCAPALAILLLCVLHLQASPQSVPTATWQQGGALSIARTGATATLMADVRILIVGGKDGNGNALASAEVFNPDGTMAPVPSMSVPRYGHGAIPLPDGSILGAGGHTHEGGGVKSAQVVDPVAKTWHLLPDARSGTSAEAHAFALVTGRRS